MKEKLQSWVSEQAERYPDKAAVTSDERSFTYSELEAVSNQLARVISECGHRKGDRIALMMPRTAIAIPAMIGIYKAGGICVPMDVGNPVERLRRMLEVCECRFGIAAATEHDTVTRVFEGMSGRRRAIIGWVGDDEAPSSAAFTLGDVEQQLSGPLGDRSYTPDVAQILFTSGSTGMPKGVAVTHESIIAFVRWAVDYFGIDSTDRIAGHTPMHFDLSLFDIFATLATGAELRLFPEGLNLDPVKLVARIREEAITHWLSVPSLQRYIERFDALDHDGLPDLRRLLWCGEVLPTPTLIHWMERLPNTSFTNLYGPTEACIASTYYQIPAIPESKDEPVPIGVPCDSDDVLILDEDLNPAKPGEISEIFIRGKGLSPGYWNDRERTREVFIQDPFSRDPSARVYRTGDLGYFREDGLIQFVGRKDSQIKSRGFRIELGEIERAVDSLDDVAECVVVALPEQSFEGATIGCAYSLKTAGAISKVALRRELLETLPGYMIPTRWLELVELPRNRNGKIDRKRVGKLLAGGEGTPVKKTATG